MNQQQDPLKSKGSLRVVKKGGNILFQGEIPRHVIIVRSGVVRAYSIASSGEERIVSLHGKGDVLPISWIFGATPNSLFYYDAASDVRLFTVRKDDYLQALADDPELMNKTMGELAYNYSALLIRITGLEQSRVIEKIGFTLYYLLIKYGVEKKSGFYTLDMKLSQSMLASLVGISRESTTKNLKVLKDKGVISYSSFTYTINKPRLESFLGEDSFRELTSS